MSFSDADSSSHGGEYKNFRQTSRDRLLHEMLRSSKSSDSKSSWKVLIMDKVTVKVMSHSCKMADITAEGISLVEDLFRRRQPLPSMDAIYFIQPTRENVVMFLSDMSGREPLYKKAFVYFSSPVPKILVNHIKNDTSVLPRIGGLREMNLEYFSIDSQGFITDHERALEDLYGEDTESSGKFDSCLTAMGTRIATVFASLKEFPFVRYRAAKGLDGSSDVSFRDLVPTKLAASIWNSIATYKSSIPNFPQTETCELLILDRSVDQIAPVIHEWTYDAMCHDLLGLDGNKYLYEVPSKSGGQPERKEALLEDHDPIWLELRHNHIADASERLYEKMTNFTSKNKAAQLQQRDGSELSTRDLQKVVQALPQYSEQMEKLSLHVEIAGKINQIITDTGLRDLGQLEQDLVFGDAGTKEVINFIRTKQDTTCENKLRLMMIYASVYPEKFEGDKATKLMQELLENLSKGELPKNEYQCMNEPGPTSSAANGAIQATSVRAGQSTNPHSMRSRRTATWARPRLSDDGCSSDSVLRNASSDFKRMGQRIFVFIIGGATRSELRVCHKLTAKLKREVIIGSSSIDDPPEYITKLKMLSEKELSVDDITI